MARVRQSQGIEWADCDDVLLQDDSGTLRPAWPRHYARQIGLERGDAVTPHVHMGTGAVVFTPPGVSLDDFLTTLER